MLVIIYNQFLRSNYTFFESLSDSTGLTLVWVLISDHFSLIFVVTFALGGLYFCFESFHFCLGVFISFWVFIFYDKNLDQPQFVRSLIIEVSSYKVGHKIVTTRIAMVVPSQSEPTINYPA